MAERKLKNMLSVMKKVFFSLFFYLFKKDRVLQPMLWERKGRKKNKKNKRLVSIEFFIKDLFIINVNKYAFFFGLVHI